tara:strand:+ start:2570 stop:6097 length:3528 start_codon:yes stop_codon:yes gene_type:complete
MNRRKVKVYAPNNYKKGGQSFEPHKMFDPETGQSYNANTMEDHLNMKQQGFLHKDEISKKKTFTKKLMKGGTSTAMQNQNINEFGSNRVGNLKNFMSTNAVNAITREEANQFSNQVLRQPPMMPQQFNNGGSNQQNPLMINADNTAKLNAMGQAYIANQKDFTEGMGQFNKGVGTLIGSYDPTNVTVKSKTKVNKEYKPMWKEAVKDWRNSGADESEFQFDPNNPYLNYDYNMEFGGTYMTDPQEAAMYMDGLPEFNDGGKTAIRKSIADKIRSGLSPKRHLKKFTTAEKNRFTLDTMNQGNFTKIMYDNIPVGDFVAAEKQILNPKKFGTFNKEKITYYPPIAGLGSAAGEGELPGVGQISDADMRARAAKFMNTQVSEEEQLANQAAAEANIAAAEGKGFNDDFANSQASVRNGLDPDRELYESDDLYAGEKQEDAADVVKKTEGSAKTNETTDDTTDETIDETTNEVKTDSEGNVNYDDEFTDDEDGGDENTDITDVRDPAYTIPGTSVPWNTADTYLDYYKHRGRGFLRPDKTVMKFSHYADSPGGGTAMPSSPNAPANAAQSELDKVIARETEGMTGREKRVTARKIKQAARKGDLQAYATDQESFVESGIEPLDVLPANKPVTEADMAYNMRGTNEQVPLELQGTQGMTKAEMDAQMRGIPTPQPMGPEVDPNLEFIQDYISEDGSLDIKSLKAEGFDRNDIKGLKKAYKNYDNNKTNLTPEYADGQLARATKDMFSSKNDRLLDKEIKNKGLKGEEAAAYKENIKNLEFQDAQIQKQRQRKFEYDAEGRAKVDATNQEALLKNNPFINTGDVANKPKETVETKAFDTEGMSFNEAFAAARQQGLDSFTWNGKSYGTNVAKKKEVAAPAAEAVVAEQPASYEGPNFLPKELANMGKPMNLARNLKQNFGIGEGDKSVPFTNQSMLNQYLNKIGSEAVERGAQKAIPRAVSNANQQAAFDNMFQVMPQQYGGLQMFEDGAEVNPEVEVGAYMDEVEGLDPSASFGAMNYFMNQNAPTNPNINQPAVDPQQPQSEWATTKVKRKETPFGGFRKAFTTLAPGVGAGVAAIGNKINNPNLMDEMYANTAAANNFTAGTGNRGFIATNPSGVNMGISAPVQFTGGAQLGGTAPMYNYGGANMYEQGGSNMQPYRMTNQELQQFLQAGGRIEIIN